MWPALVLSLLTAIFAWLWYRRSEEGREPGAGTAVTAGSEHRVPAESELPAADPDRENPEPCVRQRAARPQTPEDGTDLQSDLTVQSKEAANYDFPLTVGDESSVADGTPDVTVKGDMPGDLQEPPNDAPKREGSQDNPQVHLITEEALEVSMVEQWVDNFPEEHLGDTEQTKDDESHIQVSSKDAVHSGEVDMHPSDMPEASKDECPPLNKEPQLDLEEEHPQGNAGHPSDKSLVKEAPNSLKAKGILNPDLYVVMVNTLSNVGNTTVADQFMNHDAVEECNIKRRSMCSDAANPSAGLQENVDAFHSGLNESIERMSDVHKLGADPQNSPLDICNLVLDQEKETDGLDGSYTDEKTTVCTSSEVNIHEIDHLKTRKIATIQPMPQNINFSFKVHYITQSDSQIIAVIGDHEKLGKWEMYVPLTSGDGGFWSHLITLPVDTNFSWKFVMVENGKIKRWEECNDRFLKIAHEDIEVQLFWGYP